MKTLFIVLSFLMLYGCSKENTPQKNVVSGTYSVEIDTTYYHVNDLCSWQYNQIGGDSWCSLGAQEGNWYYWIPSIDDSSFVSCEVIDSIGKTGTVYQFPVELQGDVLNYGFNSFEQIYLIAFLNSSATKIPYGFWLKCIYYVKAK